MAGGKKGAMREFANEDGAPGWSPGLEMAGLSLRQEQFCECHPRSVSMLGPREQGEGDESHSGSSHIQEHCGQQEDT